MNNAFHAGPRVKWTPQRRAAHAALLRRIIADKRARGILWGREHIRISHEGQERIDELVLARAAQAARPGGYECHGCGFDAPDARHRCPKCGSFAWDRHRPAPIGEPRAYFIGEYSGKPSVRREEAA